jgi:hypothetical protein
MITEDERMEKFLQGVVPPDYQSDEHRQQLLSQVLARVQTNRSGSGRLSRWKTIVLLAGLLCAAAAATELVLQVRHYYFEGRSSDGSYHFAADQRTPYESTGTIISSGGKELDAAAIEQKRRDLEEIDVLRQRDARELVGVIDTAINGKSSFRTFQYKYVLADGRTETMGEGGSEPGPGVSPAQRERDQQEIAGLRQRGAREITQVLDTDLAGQLQRTLICRYVLSDGREQSVGEGDPALPAPSRTLTPEQLREMWRLVKLKQGKFLGTVSTALYGQTFIFQRYSFELSDGTVVNWSDGRPEGEKRELTDSDWKELRDLTAAHRGETLGTYEEVLRGKLFKFTRVKYVLSDGTEVIRSPGEPSSEK